VERDLRLLEGNLKLDLLHHLHPEDGSELRVVDGPPEGGPVPLHPEEPQLISPLGPDGIDPGLLTDVANRLFGKASKS
jgi:hypothetical protein